MFSPDKEPLRATPLENSAPTPPPPAKRGLGFYVSGGWLFFKKMWPTLYDLSTNQTYVYASAIAFNALMSFFSFIVLIGSFLDRLLNWHWGYQTAYRLIMTFVPVKSAMLFESLDKVTRGKGGEVGWISFALLIIGSAGVFQALEVSLNHAWGFREERSFLKQYLLYPGLVIAAGAIMLVCVGIASIWDGVLFWIFGDKSVVRDVAFESATSVLSLPFLAAVLALIYYLVPTGKVRINQVIFSAIGMSFLWVILSLVFKFAFLFPFAQKNFQESYGELFGLMAVVTWVFVSSFLLILGANLSAKEILPRAWNRG